MYLSFGVDEALYGRMRAESAARGMQVQDWLLMLARDELDRKGQGDMKPAKDHDGHG